jgi:hypothetical protein
MSIRSIRTLGGIALAAVLVSLAAAAKPGEGQKMRYLVMASEGPGFSTPEETLQVLQKGILPTFDALMKLEADKKIIAGGLPVGERKFVFILEASSNEEADQILRDIPAWGVLKWQVMPLQSFEGRADKERSVVSELKKRLK